MRILKVLLLVSCFLTHGCLSITTSLYAKPEHKRQLYSGSALWFELIHDWSARKDSPEVIEYIAFFPAVAIDLPLCLVADTLLLTYKFYYRSTHPEVVIPYKPDVTPADKTTPSTSTSPKAL